MPAPATPMQPAPRRAGAPATRRTRRRGFSLIEMLTALVILGILTAAALPRLNIAGYQADAGARTVAGALQAAQRLAVTQQSTVVVGFDLARNRVRVLEDTTGNLTRDCSNAVCERITWRTLDAPAQFAAPPTTVSGASAAALVNVTQTLDGMPSIVFRRDGAASAAAEIYVKAQRNRVTQWRGIVVTRTTGRVDWYGMPQPAGTWRRRSL